LRGEFKTFQTFKRFKSFTGQGGRYRSGRYRKGQGWKIEDGVSESRMVNGPRLSHKILRNQTDATVEFALRGPREGRGSRMEDRGWPVEFRISGRIEDTTVNSSSSSAPPRFH
jgi:hypothetical protein